MVLWKGAFSLVVIIVFRKYRHIIIIISSIAATVKKVAPHALPDTVQVTGDPIPDEMPPEFLKKYETHVEDIGEPTTACFFTLSDVDPQKWYPSPSD